MPLPPNLDREEIRKFDRVSPVWCDTAGEMRMLHVINPLRCSFVLDQLDQPEPRIVDVGCGGGILTEALARAHARVTGIDLTASALAAAHAHAQGENLVIDYRLQSAEEIAASEPGSVDAVTCMEMLEHVPDPAAVIAACARLLKPGGRAFFSTINRTPKAFLFAIVAGEYLLHLLPRGSHHYRRLIRPRELRTWAVAADLMPVAAASLMFNPFTRRFRVVADREDVNYMLSFVKRG